MNIASAETELNQKVIHKLSNALKEAYLNMREIKNVLRVPRMYHKYNELYKELTTEQ